MIEKFCAKELSPVWMHDSVWEKIGTPYVNEQLEDIRAFDIGHINLSLYAETKENRYVLQRLWSWRYTKEQIEKLEYNYLHYKNACETAAEKGVILECPQWIRDREGQFFRIEGGDYWRMYQMITGDMLKPKITDDELVVCGAGLAKLHYVLSFFPEKPHAVYPFLHDLTYYFEEYCLQEKSDKYRVPEMDRVIEEKIGGYLKLSYPKEDVVHGDAKLGNMIVSGNRVKAFIDLDTLMVGSRLEDIADLIRSCCIYREEEEAYIIKMVLKGYQAAAKELSGDMMLTKEEAELMPDIVDKICFELGLRYYTDHLSGGGYFIERFSGENLQKAKQWLLQEMPD